MNIDLIYKKIYQYSGWLTLILLSGLICIYGNIEIKDLDLWLHLASGRYILDTGHIPSVDVLSHTMVGQAWNNHEWLFQILITKIYQLFGPEGWITLRLMVLSLIFIHLFLIGYDKEKPLWPAVLLVLVFLNFQERLLLRPEIFSLLFFVMYIYILSFHLDKRKMIFSIVLLQVLWVNMHGFFIFGILLIGLVALAEFLKRNVSMPQQWKTVGRLTDSEYQNIKFIFLGVIAACFLNPNFIEGAVYPLKVFLTIGNESSVFFKEIVELHKPITFGNIFAWHPYPYFRWLILLPAMSFIVNRRHIDIGALTLWLIFLVLSLSAVRNVPFYALVAYFVTLINLQHLKWEHMLPMTMQSQRSRYSCSIIILLFLNIWLIRMVDAAQWHGYYDFDRKERKLEFGGVSLNNFAYKAVDFLKENHIRGNVFNDFNSGAYLLGRTHPDIHVFMDGRTELYGADFFNHYKKIWRGNRRLLDQTLEQYPMDIAFLNSVYKAPPAELTQYFNRHPDWHLVYFDHDALIYLKDTPQQRPIIQKTAIDLNSWKSPGLNLFAEKNIKLSPYRQIIRAETLVNLKHFNQAQEELSLAHQLSPRHSEVYRLYGTIAFMQKNYKVAGAQFRKALVAKPSNDLARFQYAKTLYYLGYYKESQHQIGRVQKKHSKNFKVLVLAALLKMKDQSFERVWPLFESAIELSEGEFLPYIEEEPIEAMLKERIIQSVKKQSYDR